MILLMTHRSVVIVKYYIAFTHEGAIQAYQQYAQHKSSSVSQLIRVNATFLCVYRLRHNKYLECF